MALNLTIKRSLTGCWPPRATPFLCFWTFRSFLDGVNSRWLDRLHQTRWDSVKAGPNYLLLEGHNQVPYILLSLANRCQLPDEANWSKMSCQPKQTVSESPSIWQTRVRVVWPGWQADCSICSFRLTASFSVTACHHVKYGPSSQVDTSKYT